MLSDVWPEWAVGRPGLRDAKRDCRSRHPPLYCLSEEFKEKAEFVIATDRGFDIFNSCRPLNSKKYRCGFNVPETFGEQYDALMTFSNLIRDGKVGSTKRRYSSRTGYHVVYCSLKTPQCAPRKRTVAEDRHVLHSDVTLEATLRGSSPR